ncbi:zinc finger protein 345-like, partial [Scleropages formosus]
MDMCIKTEPDDQDISHPEEMESGLHLDTEQINTEIVMVKIKEDHSDLQLCSTTEEFCCPLEQLNSSACLLSRQRKSKTGAIRVLQRNQFQGPSSTKLPVNEAACDLLQNTSVKLEDSLIAAGDYVQKKGAMKQSVVPVVSDTSHKARKQLCRDGATQKSQKWQCPQCRKVLKSQSQLKIHLQIHSGVKYCCIECGRSFSQPFRLKQHQLMHCGKQTYSGNLKQHQLVHTGEKPYECSQCGKNFSQGGTLKRHQLIHS